MSTDTDIADLERQGWQVLSTGPREAQSFYGAILAPDAEMLFPGGMRITGRERILETMGGPPWASFEISDLQVVALSGTVQAVTYKVVAQREGTDEYHALVCSTYAFRAGVWQLVIHQHTPE
ncbi:nuclear transport factor 2 family protein [Gilvimarinus sp. F26214L]|uniref:nuclear transport factor 2 family protein n=1 Tax=Gilvimarinus sp. DZF01 TaxID=3461371 RepID=UPI0040455194